MTRKHILSGLLGAALLLAAYVTIVSAVSGWAFAREQFSAFGYYILVLALGFGVQVGLWSTLRTRAYRSDASGRVVAVSGTTSTVAMVSCCAHYLVNVLPILGTTGIITLISQYQVDLFWLGILANALGTGLIARRIMKTV
ncbi:MAG: hypothetical protein A3B37_02340 [Candidatus Sungbacteria bacterium RIFCSPLOWO2_01_FULL_59_16]|uniref:Uncharacterized protein n=1 Tax=Candidatus Sungbacteria bacterium RIFCSPLOWO2_01_FULL_59_16 TaxID=1802280 RepID=A0A1G2LEZ4_9BACT|nr:MAG: hypothetical protein A3B37_02340 [Candidatus Sungbacteria bacterium RIFCSPLOWO2_01_FULL_59_16]